MRHPSELLATPFPCGSNYLFEDKSQSKLHKLADKFAANGIDNNLMLIHRASIACFLGQPKEAILFYAQGAAQKDDWQALQAYFLFTKLGDNESAYQVLIQSTLGLKDINNFHRALGRSQVNINPLTLARFALHLDDKSEVAWKIYLSACRNYQTNYEYRDYHEALICYDNLTHSQNVFSKIDLALIHIYQAETKRSLYPEFNARDVLNEYYEAIEIDPSNHLAYLGISTVFLWDLINYEQAKSYVEKALILRPNCADAYLSLGDVYRKQGDYQDAMGAYERALIYRPNWNTAIKRIQKMQDEIDISN